MKENTLKILKRFGWIFLIAVVICFPTPFYLRYSHFLQRELYVPLWYQLLVGFFSALMAGIFPILFGFVALYTGRNKPNGYLNWQL